jgi:hypothetical protein
MSCDAEETLISLDSSDEDVFYQLKKAHQGEFRQSLLFPDPLRRILPRAVTRFRRRRQNQHNLLHHHHLHHHKYPHHGLLSRRLRRIFSLVKCLAISTVLLVLFTLLFRPSYTHRPPHYRQLETKTLLSTEPGRANYFNEQIFVAISLYDKNGHLAGGRWGESVLELIDLLGPDNVFLSIYQSDTANGTALDALQTRVRCKHEIVNDVHISKDNFPTVTMPDGSEHVKRVLYLAEMRNKALRPLDKAGPVKYDKILFLNDIFFHPLDAAQLLFSTNVGRDGKAQYLAACGLDYSNPFKFYDLFVTRDLEGYSMGLPFYPIFSNAGKAQSRSHMLSQSDAVPVKSCWSGMLAVQARYIQATTKTIPDGFQDIGAHNINPKLPRKVTAPIRFRAEPELFFDACECCLFLADLLQVAKNARDEIGIYINPFIRVAYSPKVLAWLPITRRFERLFSWPHRLVTVLVGLPTSNPHRTVEEGDTFEEEVWRQDINLPGNGSWHITQRTARNGLYCGVREMQVLQNSPRTEDTNWFHWPIPPNQKVYFPT